MNNCGDFSILNHCIGSLEFCSLNCSGVSIGTVDVTAFGWEQLYHLYIKKISSNDN